MHIYTLENSPLLLSFPALCSTLPLLILAFVKFLPKALSRCHFASPLAPELYILATHTHTEALGNDLIQLKFDSNNRRTIGNTLVNMHAQTPKSHNSSIRLYAPALSPHSREF